MKTSLHKCTAKELIGKVEKGSVDLILTDPPQKATLEFQQLLGNLNGVQSRAFEQLIAGNPKT